MTNDTNGHYVPATIPPDLAREISDSEARESNRIELSRVIALAVGIVLATVLASVWAAVIWASL